MLWSFLRFLAWGLQINKQYGHQPQRRMDSGGRWRYLDASFKRSDGRLVHVEIDGGVHLSLAVRSRDTLKDNHAVLDQRLVLRYVSADIYADSPEAVAQLRRATGVVST